MSRDRKRVEKVMLLTLMLTAFVITTGAGVGLAFGQEVGETGQLAEPPVVTHRWDLAVAISVAIAVPCLAAGYAVGKVGAAALGAASENPELLTRSLIFVALAEGIAIYGLLVAILLYLKI
ncbi:MAG: ATP synthase subunit C [Candidatus Brocadiia bacterium]